MEFFSFYGWKENTQTYTVPFKFQIRHPFILLHVTFRKLHGFATLVQILRAEILRAEPKRQLRSENSVTVLKAILRVQF